MGGERWAIYFIPARWCFSVVCEEVRPIGWHSLREMEIDEDRGRAKVRFADRSDSFSAYAVLGP